VKILAVIVRYLMPVSESASLQGIRAAFGSRSDLTEDYSLMVWDNSPKAIQTAELPVNCTYRHTRLNAGVSGAYNGAMEYAIDHGYQWMLLLDQDTKVTERMLHAMRKYARELSAIGEIAAIVPNVYVRGVIISPRHRRLLKDTSYPAGECGIAPGEATAINSGTLIRVESLREIGGYSQDFWLDYSDVYVFHRFFVGGRKVFRAADVEIEHDLSLMDYNRLMTPKRSMNFSEAEAAFHDLFYGPLKNSLLTLRLLARAIKHRLKYEDPEFSIIAWTQFMRRIRLPREDRIAQFRQNASSVRRGRALEVVGHDL